VVGVDHPAERDPRVVIEAPLAPEVTHCAALAEDLAHPIRSDLDRDRVRNAGYAFASPTGHIGAHDDAFGEA
jgi:hypothetical protein